MLEPIHLLIAGWECQGFFVVGKGAGFDDARSWIFIDLLQIIQWAQRINPSMGYVLENSPAQFDTRSQILADFAVIKHCLGSPLLIDVVQCGSYAHCLRNMWTNLVPLAILEIALQHTHRPISYYIAEILDPNTVCKPVLK